MYMYMYMYMYNHEQGCRVGCAKGRGTKDVDLSVSRKGRHGDINFYCVQFVLNYITMQYCNTIYIICKTTHPIIHKFRMLSYMLQVCDGTISTHT